MASDRATPSLGQLWQLPLLLISLGLFGAAGYLFINPTGGPTLDQKIEAARLHLRYNRPEAALDQLNQVVISSKLQPATEARVHLLMAEALEAAQKLHRISIASNHRQIIEQTRLALAQGAHPDAEVYRRLGESYEALGRSADALDSYRRAIVMDSRRSPHLQRKVIELQAQQRDTAPAEASLDAYLKDPKLADSERAWAMQQKAQLLIDRGSYIDAKPLLNESLRLNVDRALQGEANYRLGYCLWKMGDPAEAERRLRVARDQLKTANPLDADAAWLLGQIRQEQNDPPEALAFYQAVLTSHPESSSALVARLGRAECRVLLGQEAGGLTDFHDAVAQINSQKRLQAQRANAIAALRQSSAILTAQDKQEGALELLAYEQSLDPNPPADFYARLANVYAKRAEQVERTIANAPDASERILRQQQVRDLRTRGGTAWIACSRALTIADDKAHAEAMWKGVDLYDRAGNLQMVTSALELFAVERPNDGQTPDALLRLGRAYQAAGMFDRAVVAFERDQFRYPQSLAASKSGVPLAEAYVAKGPEFYSRAEKVLIGVLENPILTPDAEEFGQALFQLGQLYYRVARYEDAVVRLREMGQRYPNDSRTPQILFLMADSYRKSAALLKAKLTGPPAGQAEAAAARKDRLANARQYYDRVIDRFRAAPPVNDVDKLDLKLSYFYRADCVYDLGQYENAVTLYDQAATRYQSDPSALSAYVQIVNAYCELGKPLEARHANERARTLLARMAPPLFNDGAFAMPKEYWERWLKWSTDAGLLDQKLIAQKPGGPSGIH